MKEWIVVHLTNVFGFGAVWLLAHADFHVWIELGLTGIGVGALAWYNIERARNERRKRKNS